MTDVNAGGAASAETASDTSQSTSGPTASLGGGFAAIDAAASEPAPAAAGTAGGSSAAQDSDEGGQLRASLKGIEDRAQEIRAWSAARQEDARDLVEARPLAVVGAAFGVGLLLGLVASRV